MFLMFSVYDHKIGTNRMLIIDATTMKPISDTEMPSRLPFQLHQFWYPKEK